MDSSWLRVLRYAYDMMLHRWVLARDFEGLPCRVRCKLYSTLKIENESYSKRQYRELFLDMVTNDGPDGFWYGCLSEW